MSYEEEKKYLVSKAKEFLGNAEVIVDADARGNYETICANIGM